MPNLLYITNIAGAKMAINFSGTAIGASHELGYSFHAVANRSLASKEQIQQDETTYNVRLHHAEICRSPFSLKNLTAYKQVLSLIKNENIDFIHCNTPVGGMVGRIAGKKCKVKKIIYQVHGFHFYQGAPKKNWLIYYFVEKFLARFTDAIITINSEDFEAAKKFRLKEGGKVYYVHGVGITLSDFEGLSQKREEKRAELQLNDTDVALISAGDLILRKNYATAIRAIAKCENPSLHYFICGKGPEKENLEALARELSVEKQIHFLGFRADVKELMAASDIFLFSTLQEGLPRSMMEAMASGLPCVASEIRGNVDLIENGKNGYLCPATDDSAFSKAIENLANSPELRLKISKENLEKIKQYDVSVVEKEIKEIYEEVLKA